MNANTFLFTSIFNKTVLNIWILQSSSWLIWPFQDLPVLYIKWKGIHLDPCNFVARVKHGFSEVWQEISFQHILNAIMFNLSQIKEKIHITTNMNIHCQIHMEFIVPQFFILYTIINQENLNSRLWISFCIQTFDFFFAS